MAAKHKTTKKTVKRKTTPKKQEELTERVIPEQAQQPAISNTSFQPVQAMQSPQSIQQPVQPIQQQSVQPVQPMQTVPLSNVSQQSPVQEASSFESSMTQPVVGSATAPTTAPTDTPADAEPSGAEPEIKIGIENKLTSDAEVKSTDVKSDSSQGAVNNQGKSGQ